jgi:cytochrome oxidase assembly protein ShyY1
MPAGYSFRPRLWSLLAAALACAAGVALGNWQAGRAAEKRAAAHAERIALRGEFLAERTIFLENRFHHGRLGYEVITPLRLEGGRAVLVNRGWAAMPQDVRTPSGVVTIEGVAVPHVPRVMQAGPEKGGRVRQNLDVAAYAAEAGLALEPRVIEQHSDAPDGLQREWPSAEAGAEKNAAYALQWYSLAALAVVLGVVFCFRRDPEI